MPSLDICLRPHTLDWHYLNSLHTLQLPGSPSMLEQLGHRNLANPGGRTHVTSEANSVDRFVNVTDAIGTLDSTLILLVLVILSPGM